MMKRRLGVAVLAISVGAAAAAMPAGAGKARRVLKPYSALDDNVSVGGPEPVPVAGTADSDQVYDFDIRSKDGFVEVDLVDDTERPVAGIVSQWKKTGEVGGGGGGAGGSVESYRAVTYVRFCGETTKPVKLKPKLDVRVIVHEGTCTDGTPSVPTEGDIVVDFYRG
jgi:hypothetical protein